MVGVDPNLRPTATPDLPNHLRRLTGVMAAADIVKLSTEDAAVMRPGADPAATAAWVQSLGPGLVLLTRGGAGVTAVTRGGTVDLPVPEVPVVDTIGAGDAYAAGILAGLHDRHLLSKEGVAALGVEDLEAIHRFAAAGCHGHRLPARSGPSVAVGAVTRSGMGAVTDAEGVTFRVWAPFATGVSVAGSFNGWSADSHPLSPEGGGVWSIHVAGVQEGVEYRFVVSTDDGVLWRNDPYARAMTHSAGNSIVCAAEFDWGDTQFEMPSWDDLVIYELHVGTFNDAPGGGPGGFDSVERRLGYLPRPGGERH